MPRVLKITGNVTMALISVSALVVLVMGQLMISISRDIGVLGGYLANASGMQPKLEESMLMYTTKTGHVMEQLMAFRPETEEDYVAFISQVESVGKRLSLHVDIKSFVGGQQVERGKKKEEVVEKTLSYALSFYGTGEDALRMVSELQELPYFITIESINYKNLDYLDDDERKLANVNMVIKLFIK